MKIKPEHYAHIKAAIAALPRAKITGHRLFLATLDKPMDLEMRLRWDSLWAARLIPWLVVNVYTYANDDHIDTALRRIMRELDLAA